MSTFCVPVDDIKFPCNWSFLRSPIFWVALDLWKEYSIDLVSFLGSCSPITPSETLSWGMLPPVFMNLSSMTPGPTSVCMQSSNPASTYPPGVNSTIFKGCNFTVFAWAAFIVNECWFFPKPKKLAKGLGTDDWECSGPPGVTLFWKV